MHRLQELVRLHRLNTGAREVARLLKMSPNTERLYRQALEPEGLLKGDPQSLPSLEALQKVVVAHRGGGSQPEQSVSSVEAWRGAVSDMLDRGAGPGAIYDALRLDHGYSGSVSAVKRFCRRLQEQAGPRVEDVAIPVETDPGEVAQVDFGYVGKLYDPLEGRLRKAWVFVMVLGHSRWMYAALVFDQKTTTWLDLHIKAFRSLGGVPRVVVPDNLKAAVIRTAFASNDDCAINRSYRELARHYGFKIDPTPPRAPKKKGKVESAVKYVKRNFFKPRAFADIDIAQRDLSRWVDEVANLRIHGTTRRRPIDALANERPVLHALPSDPYNIIEWKEATLHADCHLFFDGRLYSAPWPLVGSKLWVRATPATVMVFDDTKRVATHSRSGNEKRRTQDAHLPEHRRDYRHRRQSYWEERAARMGKDVAAYVHAIFESDDVLLQLRTVQQVVRHLEQFPRQRAQRASARALHYSAFKYGALKTILRQGLDLQPLPVSEPVSPPLSKPRFARSSSEIVNPNLELFSSSDGEKHEYH